VRGVEMDMDMDVDMVFIEYTSFKVGANLQKFAQTSV